MSGWIYFIEVIRPLLMLLVEDAETTTMVVVVVEAEGVVVLLMVVVATKVHCHFCLMDVHKLSALTRSIKSVTRLGILSSIVGTTIMRATPLTPRV
jgi:hypothetical protein